MAAIDNKGPATLPASALMRVDNEVLRFRQYWHVILERRWLVIATFTLFFTLGAIATFRATPIFTASTRLQIDPETGGVLAAKEIVSFGAKDQEYLQTQYKNLQSRSLIELVISQLSLDVDPRYKKAQDKVAAVAADFDVSPVRLTRLVEVRASHPNPKTAQLMANTLVDNFILQARDLKQRKAYKGYQLLKDEAQKAELDLKNAMVALQTFRQEKRMVSLDERTQGENLDTFSVREARAALDLAQRSFSEVQKNLDEANKGIKAGRDPVEVAAIANERTVTELKLIVARDEANLAQLSTRYGPKHPTLLAAQATLAASKEKLKAEAQRAFDNLVSQAEVENRKVEQAKQRVTEAEGKLQELFSARTEFDILMQKKQKEEVLFQAIISKLKEYDLNTQDPVDNMVVIDPAQEPPKPSRPNKPLMLSASVLGGLLLALGMAFFVNFLDDSVKSQDDVENYLRLPFLGYIPNIKSMSVVERDLQAHLRPTSGTSEAFRTLRAAVSLARNSDKMRTIAITSTIPSEGKSLVASNFAIVMAQTGLRTLLVDGDLRRPSVHKAFQLQSPVGLSAYLAERVASVDEIVHSSEVPNLDIVCCGATPANPSELVGSKRMLQFLEETAARYDRVVVDCPPVSAVSDPLVIAAMCDGAIYVTKFNKIRREHALRSVQRVQDAGIHLMGLVLNDIDFEGKDSYYYSYHYYQNRYYTKYYRTRPGSGGTPQASSADKPKEKAGKA
jgi:polysaccharide biosynthesis transport protein